MELNDLLKYQGIELAEDATIEDYKSAFDAKYLTKDNALQDESIRNHWAGETTSKFARELTRTAKENDIELTPEEKKLPVGDLSRLIVAKKQEAFDSKLTELDTKRKPSEEFNTLKEKYESLNTRYTEELTAKKELQGMLEKKENEFVTFQKDFKLNQSKDAIFGSLKYSDNASDLLKKGFLATVNEKYSISLGEDESPIITDKEGNRIKDPNKHGSFLTPTDVLSNELNEAGLGKVVETEKFPEANPREFKKALDNNGIAKPKYAKPSSGHFM
jgi:hypothetical protein